MNGVKNHSELDGPRKPKAIFIQIDTGKGLT